MRSPIVVNSNLAMSSAVWRYCDENFWFLCRLDPCIWSRPTQWRRSTQKLTDLFLIMWKQETIPQDFKDAVIVVVYKKKFIRWL